MKVLSFRLLFLAGALGALGAQAETRVLGPVEAIERTVTVDAQACQRALQVRSVVSGGAYAASVSWYAECAVPVTEVAGERVIQSSSARQQRDKVTLTGSATSYHFRVELASPGLRPDQDKMARDAMSAIEGLIGTLPNGKYTVTATRIAR